MKSVNFINQTSIAAIPTITVSQCVIHFLHWKTRNATMFIGINGYITKTNSDLQMTDSNATASDVQFIAGDSYMSSAFETADSNSAIFCEQCIFSGYSGPQVKWLCKVFVSREGSICTNAYSPV